MVEKVCTIPEETIRQAIQEFPTPFYLYDEQAIRKNMQSLLQAFSKKPFKQYFALKATPTPAIMKILLEEGSAIDCSSLAELLLCEKLGLRGDEIMFSSNNTPKEEFEKALELGAIINFDDITHIDFFEKEIGSLPETVSFRYNPGELDFGNAIIGKPSEAKFGLTRQQMIDAYGIAKEKGCTRFGIHTMLVSNELGATNFSLTAELLFSLIKEIQDTHNIKISFVNLGGGIGIPYQPEDNAVDYEELAKLIFQVYDKHFPQEGPQLMMENGRCITGPYAYLITKVRHTKDTFRKYLCVDASMCDLMRPGMYDAYHHISVLGKEEKDMMRYDVVGSLCENNDKFAVNRVLPKSKVGDYLIIHDVGAHGHTMGFNYNGKLRCAELLLKNDGSIGIIRRAQTMNDYFATLDL